MIKNYGFYQTLGPAKTKNPILEIGHVDESNNECKIKFLDESISLEEFNKKIEGINSTLLKIKNKTFDKRDVDYLVQETAHVDLPKLLRSKFNLLLNVHNIKFGSMT